MRDDLIPRATGATRGPFELEIPQHSVAADPAILSPRERVLCFLALHQDGARRTCARGVLWRPAGLDMATSY